MAINFFSTVDAKITEEVIKLAIYPVSIFAAGVAMIAVPLLAMWTTYRLLLVLAGQIAEPFTAIMKDFAVRGCILGLAGSLGLLYSIILDPIKDTQQSMAADLSGMSNTSSIFVNIENHLSQVGAMMEATMGVKEGSESSVEQATRENGGEPLSFWGWLWESTKDATAGISASLEDLGSFFELMGIMIKLTIVEIGIMTLGITSFISIILNKTFFYLGLGVSPLFIMFLAFDSTRGWFTSWLSSTLGYCFSYPIAMMVVTLLLNAYQDIYNQESLSFADAIVCLAVGIIFSVLIKRIGDATSAWFGATNITDITSGAITRFVSDAIAPAKMMGKGAAFTAKAPYHVGRDSYKFAKDRGSRLIGAMRGKSSTPEVRVK